MTTIRLRGRDYTVESFERTNAKGEVEVNYMLTGKRGGKFSTMRNYHNRSKLFVVPFASFNRTLEGVWLTDASGSLEIVSQ